MEEKNLQTQIDSLNSKLDIILEEIELQRQHRREMDDLKDDVMRVGKDLYQTAIVELEEVHDYLNTGDILHLSKKLLRNVNTISGVVDQLESVKDFLQDAAPLTRESIIDIMNKLDEFDRKGYFEFVRELSKALDNVVTSFTVEDVKNLGENIVTILNTIKNLTQPEMLHTIDNALNVYKNLDIEVSDKVSTFSLLKELNSAETKRGLAFAIRFLKKLSSQTIDNKLINIQKVQTN